MQTLPQIQVYKVVGTVTVQPKQRLYRLKALLEAIRLLRRDLGS